MDSKFFCFLISGAQQVKDQLAELCQWSTRDFLNQRILHALDLPLPPLPEQQEIVRRVDQLFAFADRLEARVATARKRVDALTQSILAKAFRGELVPTEAELARAEGRAYESAAQLLERIASVNAKAADKPKRKPRKRKPRDTDPCNP